MDQDLLNEQLLSVELLNFETNLRLERKRSKTIDALKALKSPEHQRSIRERGDTMSNASKNEIKLVNSKSRLEELSNKSSKY